MRIYIESIKNDTSGEEVSGLYWGGNYFKSWPEQRYSEVLCDFLDGSRQIPEYWSSHVLPNIFRVIIHRLSYHSML
jgi:hypothetical protein